MYIGYANNNLNGKGYIMERRVTIKEVAKEAGVSAATISYVLNSKESISQATKDRVYAAIEKLNYVPNLSARGLVNRESKLIGVVIPQTEDDDMLMFNNPFYSEIIGNIEYVARVNGFRVLISGVNTDESYLNLAKEHNLDGIIVIGMYPDEFYLQLKDSMIPAVLIDSYCDDHYFDTIKINDRNGAYIATKYLIDKGHKDIGIVVGMIHDNGVMQQRLLGYKDALEEYGIPYNKKMVFETKVDFDSGIEQADRIIDSKKKVTAVFACADIMALGMIKQLSNRGINVPNDISIIGFDNLNIANYSHPGLTTIEQNIAEKGKEAMKMMIKRIETPKLGKSEVILSLNVHERQSVSDLTQD